MKTEKNYHLGFTSMVLLGINGIIGSGIFLLPGQVMNLAGNWSSAVYLVITILVISIAWCFGQCASLFTQNGGAYIYAKEAFGNFVGFEIGLMRWVLGMMSWAAIIVGFISALSSLWPLALEEPFRSSIILAMTTSFCILNIFGVQIFKYINNLVTITKLIPLLLFIFFGVFFIKNSNYKALDWKEFEVGSFGAAALIIFYAFSGFETLVVVASEMKNPQKNLPLAVLLAIAFCALLYFLVQLIAIGVLGDQLANSITPLSDVAQMLLGESGKWIVSFAMLLSILGINLCASYITPWGGVALAEDGMIPRWIAAKSSFGTYTGAIILTTSCTAILAFTGSFVQLVVISVIARFAQYISTCLAVYVFQKRLSHSKGLYKRLSIKIVPAIALLGMAWLLFQASLWQLLFGLGALVFGIPLYFLQKKHKKSTECEYLTEAAFNDSSGNSNSSRS